VGELAVSSHSCSITTFRRFAFRLGVIIVLGLVWPVPSATTVTAAVSFALGAACFVGAYAFDERLHSQGLIVSTA
jgi:hypothetical protein